MTCNHYRFQVPREDADEFRAADPLPCALCDDRKATFQMIVWSSVTVRPARRNLFISLRQRIVCLFKPEAHNLPAPVSRPA
jgi:hypothetical protein